MCNEVIEHLRRLLLKAPHDPLHFAVTELERLEEVVLQLNSLNVTVRVDLHKVPVKNCMAKPEHSTGKFVEDGGIDVFVVCCVAIGKCLQAKFSIECITEDKWKELLVGDVLDLAYYDTPKPHS